MTTTNNTTIATEKLFDVWRLAYNEAKKIEKGEVDCDYEVYEVLRKIEKLVEDSVPF